MSVPNFKSLLFFLLLLVSCSPQPKPDPLLEEAFQYHQKSMQTAKEVKALMKLLPANDPKYKSLEARFKIWNESIIEVPGFEHQHDHDHDHDHHHGPVLELSPADMLLVQKELLDSVQVYKTQLLKLQEELLQ